MAKKYLNFLVFLLITSFLPISLIWLGIIDFLFRFAWISIVILLLILYSRLRNYSLSSLGIRYDNLQISLLYNGMFTIILITLGLLIFSLDIRVGPVIQHKNPLLFNIFYVLLSSPAQEFWFRGLLFAEMKARNIRNPIIMVLVSATTYSFLHIIFNNPWILISTFLVGIFWGIIYYKEPNLIGVSFSHSIVGLVTIIIGLV